MKISEVKAAVNIVDVVGRYVALKKKGREHIGLCPFHNDNHPSMAVVPHKNIFSCLSCGATGDVVDFVAKIENKSLVEAAEIISNMTGAAPAPAPDRDKPEWIYHPHGEVTELPDTHPSMGKADVVYRYNEYFAVLRWNNFGGRKELRPLSWCERRGKHQWRWQGVPENRPLYRLAEMKANPEKQIILVEGEKTADALQAVLNGHIVTTWHGGVNGLNATDFTPLKGRNVLGWPDHDALGYCAIHGVSIKIGQQINVIASPSTAPKGWDFADSGWDKTTTIGWMKANKNEPAALCDVPVWATGDTAAAYTLHDKTAFVIADNGVISCRPQPSLTELQSALPTPPPPPPPKVTTRPFKVLGYTKAADGVLYYFYSVESKLVHAYTAPSLGKSNLLSLAPAEYWSLLYPGSRGFNAEDAANNLIREAYAVGVFNTDHIRGRGAWIDDHRVVVHSGDRLIVDGDTTAVTDLDSSYIYEVNQPLNLRRGPAITPQQGAKFIEMLKTITWERPVNASLLAGWCVIAPVCGVLNWRPHVWITGGAGTGKTWIMREVVSELLGKAALVLQGESTEAGIRQMLGHDARPVIFDEAEAEDKASHDRIEKVLNLMRASSAESDAVMLKGSSSHEARSFTIRSCFCFASIIYQARKHADLTRVTVLGLKRNRQNPVESFEALKKTYAQVMTPEFIKGFHTRTLELMPVLLNNIEVFTKVAAELFGGQRLADQIAPLCAGAALLVSDKPITAAQAKKWIDQQDWRDEISLDEERDEYQCLNYLLEQVTAVEVGEYGSKVERTIGELINTCCSGGQNITDIRNARDRLGRLGIRCDGVTFTVSNTASAIKHLFKGTQWEKNHGKVLQRIDDAEPTGVVYFSAGQSNRGVKLRWRGNL